MKKFAPGLFLSLCLVGFLAFCLQVFSKKEAPFVVVPTKPTLLPPTLLHEASEQGTLIKRVYLGDTPLGMPFHLEVHRFELTRKKAEEIIAWHLGILVGSCDTLYQEANRTVYLCKGERNPTRTDTTHGFAALQGERALFLDFYLEEETLYVCSAEAPLNTFLEHELFFKKLIPICSSCRCTEQK